MDLDKAKIFLYAIDSGSLTRAAAEFDYTPSGISHMMSSMEAEVGFPLLIRTKTGIIPTENAKKLIPIMRAQCEWDEQFVQTISEINGLTQGTLRIGAYSSIASQWLPSVLARFNQDFPVIRIELLEGVWQEVDSYLQERKVDIAFFSYQPGIKYQWFSLRNDPMVVAVPLSSPLAGKSSVRMKDILGEKLIMPAFGSDVDVVNLLREENVRFEHQFSTLQNYSALGMVEQGMGILITNELITKGRTNKLKILPFNPPRSISLGIAVPMENRKSPVVSKFLAYATQMLREE